MCSRFQGLFPPFKPLLPCEMRELQYRPRVRGRALVAAGPRVRALLSILDPRKHGVGEAQLPSGSMGVLYLVRTYLHSGKNFTNDTSISSTTMH